MAAGSGTARKAALIVVDMQEDFCEPNGALAVKGGRELGSIINQLLDYPGFAMKIGTQDMHPQNHISFASLYDNAQAFTSSHTIHNPENEEETQTTLLWPNHCVEKTKGAQLIPELNTTKLTHIVQKGSDKRVESYSAFGPPFRKPAVSMSNLNQLLSDNGITHVFSVGLAFDFCVKHTAIDAVEHGYRSFVVEPATRAVMQGDEELEALRASLAQSGVEVVGLEDPELELHRV